MTLNFESREVFHYCWIACTRQNHLVKRAHITYNNNQSIESILKEFTNGEHSIFFRDTRQDSNGFLAYISNLGHVFMVSSPAKTI